MVNNNIACAVRSTWIQKFIPEEQQLDESWASSRRLVYLLSAVVGPCRDVTGENLVDALLAQQLLAPHLQQIIFGGLALQVEQVIVI